MQTGEAITRHPDKHLHRELDLVQLFLRDRNVPWAKARVLVRKPGVGNLHVRFDEREVETEHGVARRACEDHPSASWVGATE